MHTIALLPKEFEISLDFKLLEWKLVTSIIRFTEKNRNDGAWGARIPAIFGDGKFKKLVFSSSVNNNPVWYQYSQGITKNEWHTFKITQTLENGLYQLRVYQDETLLVTTSNSNAQEYKNVQVWMGDNIYEAQPGFIKNLRISGKFELGVGCSHFHFRRF